MAALRGGLLLATVTRMRHIAFAILMVLFILYGGQNWHQYAAALMTAAWVRHRGRLTARIF